MASGSPPPHPRPPLLLLLLLLLVLPLSLANPQSYTVIRGSGKSVKEGLKGRGEGGLDPFCAAPDGLFPHYWDCGLFFSCANGRGCVMRCPRNTVFHFVLKICVWPHQSTCTPRKGSPPPNWPPLDMCDGSGSLEGPELLL